MAPITTPRPQLVHNGTERIRAQFLTALHFGRLRPGDRVPSVRRLADMTGLNRKTIHRAYRCLAREGFLELRPGSGTFLSDTRNGNGSAPSPSDLLLAVNRCRAEAATLGMSLETFAKVLKVYTGHGLDVFHLAVVECNAEQIGLIRRELRLGLGVSSRPVFLHQLEGITERLRHDSDGIVTTECHRHEVIEAAKPLGIPVYCVSMSPSFPRTLVRHADHGPMVMVVQDRSFEPVFLKLLRQMAVPEETVSRFRLVEPPEAPSVLRSLEGRGAVYVSPLVAKEMAGRVPPGFGRVEVRRHLSLTTMERLRAELSLDLALRPRRS